MSQVTQMWPLIVAAVAIILGMLSGKAVANRVGGITSSLLASAFLLSSFVFGGQISAFFIVTLVGLGLAVLAAKVVSIALLSFVSGFALTLLFGRRAADSDKQ